MYFRLPKTTQEKRSYYASLEDAKEVGWNKRLHRARRSPSYLVDDWDDNDRSEWNPKSWKNYRKKQYREKSNKVKKDSTKYSNHVKRKHDPHIRCSSFGPCKTCRKNNIFGSDEERYYALTVRIDQDAQKNFKEFMYLVEHWHSPPFHNDFSKIDEKNKTFIVKMSERRKLYFSHCYNLFENQPYFYNFIKQKDANHFL